ncbi:MAG TPA: hypothetical protein VMG30_19285 [Acidobacteriota bacterium]|nr:hypothetical protein [Acidobacteriota bacterium]
MTHTMRKTMIVFMLVIWAAAGIMLADTVYMRDGRSMQGRLVGFEDGYFILELTKGNQVKYLARDVSRVVLDGPMPADDSRDRRFPRKDDSDKPSPPSSAGWENSLPFDVRLQDQWIRSQVQVRKGQRVRVEATGFVTLEGRYAVNPDGRPNSRIASLPMPDQNDGALIAVIGREDDAPQIMVGRKREFVADRNGMLYFTINHWETRNSGGAFRVTVSVDRGTGAWFGNQRGGVKMREKALTVYGNQPWVDTGVDLNSDVTVEITAEGQITVSKNHLVGPDGDIRQNNREAKYPVNSSGVGALIAKVRYSNGAESTPRFIGMHDLRRIGPSDYGRLFLGINDDNVSDNTGSYAVTIRW